MRIVLWHGYLLSGTGSNIYTQAIAREWSRAGHEVVVVCQEPNPERFDLAGAEVVRPDLPEGLLPVFVVDRYEGLEPRLLPRSSLARATSAPSAGRWSARSSASSGSRLWSMSTNSRRSPAPKPSRGSWKKHAATRRTPETAASAFRTKGTRAGSSVSSS